MNAVLLFKYLLWLRPQICVCSEPDAWLISVIVRSVMPMKVILYLREVFEDRLQAFPLRLRGVLIVVLRNIMTWLSSLTDEIVHVSSARQNWYRYLKKRGVIIHHYPRLAKFSSSKVAAVKQRSSDNVVLVHAGALRPTYGSDVLMARSGVDLATNLVAWRRVSRGSYKPFLHHVSKGKPIPTRPIKLAVPRHGRAPSTRNRWSLSSPPASDSATGS